jgi:hypothetical protein
LPAQIDRHIQRDQIEVAARIEYVSATAVFEVEELELGPDIEGVAQVGGPLEVLLEDIPRISLKRFSLRL